MIGYIIFGMGITIGIIFYKLFKDIYKKWRYYARN